jgi:hypothetical protein
MKVNKFWNKKLVALHCQQMTVSKVLANQSCTHTLEHIVLETKTHTVLPKISILISFHCKLYLKDNINIPDKTATCSEHTQLHSMHNIQSIKYPGMWGHTDWWMLIVNALSKKHATSIFRIH